MSTRPWPVARPSLPEVHGTLSVPSAGRYWRKMLAFAGPGFLVSVGYMDPGNWATDLAGGSRFGYSLLFVVMLSNLMAVLLQSLSVKLGVVTGRDLAQACREYFSRPVAIGLWVLCEIAIAACDLAEVLGSAIALQLLFGIPLVWGVCITAADVLLILLLQKRGFRYLEALVAALILTIGFCFLLQLAFSHANWTQVSHGLLIPPRGLIANPEMLYIAMGILGATVMPHNLYLHSSIVQTRRYQNTTPAKREAIRFFVADCAVALTFALFINSAILIVAASVFHSRGYTHVAEIQDAFHLLSPLLGVAGAGALFAFALLAAGQNSTLTGTLAGQIVMEGFLHIRLKPWLRRLITRLVAIVPAIVITAMYGGHGTAKLLVFSQVILSIQLSFAVIPLVMFTSDKRRMGEFVNPTWLKLLSWGAALLIAFLNGWLLLKAVVG